MPFSQIFYEWRILLLNDGPTPLDFVVDVIEQVFDVE